MNLRLLEPQITNRIELSPRTFVTARALRRPARIKKEVAFWRDKDDTGQPVAALRNGDTKKQIKIASRTKLYDQTSSKVHHRLLFQLSTRTHGKKKKNEPIDGEACFITTSCGD